MPDFISDSWKSWTSPDKKEKVSVKSKKASTHTGKVIDSYNGVKVYDNGKVRNVFGRNTIADGYNLGLKYQCVEFVKRFYYEFYNHKMPNSYGHAKDFFNRQLSDISYNKARALTQYNNGSSGKPRKNDLIVFAPTANNSFGHVAIVSKVEDNKLQIVQQNAGRGNPTREYIDMHFTNGKWYVGKGTLGWLRMP